MEFRELRSLIALADLGSIARAAERLHLSPPAIHKQLKLLEAELGGQLYDKAGRNLRLTQAGELLLPYSRDLVAEHDSVITAMEEWKGLKRGLVSIGTRPTTYVLPPVLRQFRRLNPGVEVFVETGNTPVLLESLSKGSLDLAMLVSPDLAERQNFCVEATWDFELVFVSHVRQPPRHPRLADLKNSRFILFPKGLRMQEPIDRYFAANAFEPNVTMRLDNSDLIRAMVRAGLGISVLPYWVVARDVKDRYHSVIRPVGPSVYSKLALVRRKMSYVPGAVQALIDTARTLDLKHLPLLKAPHP